MTRHLRDLGWLPIGIAAVALYAVLWAPLSAWRWLHARGRLFWDSVAVSAVWVVARVLHPRPGCRRGTMGGWAVTAIYTALGWRWMRVAGSQVAHLVPARIAQLSRTACNRHSVYDRTLETPEGLLGLELTKCAACVARDGGRQHDR